MGKKLDALLGRTFKASKFKPLVNLALSRLSVQKNQRQVRCSQFRSDVTQLLQLGQHERALLRVEQVVKEQNLLDAYVMMEIYCILLIERIKLLEQEKQCPDELKEAVSGLIFAATRCGDFPELQEIRSILASRFGKEFTSRAMELRNNCGVNPMMVQKLSTRQPSLESRQDVLKQIAYQNGIALQLEEASFLTKESLDKKEKEKLPKTHKEVGDKLRIMPEGIGKDVRLTDSVKGTKKYKDVTDAAQAAFESASYAAAAARAAVELSRSKSQDSNDRSSPSVHFNNLPDPYRLKKFELRIEGEFHEENKAYEATSSASAELNRLMSASSSASAEDILKGKNRVFSDAVSENKSEKKFDFDESEYTPSRYQILLNKETGPGYLTARATEGSWMQIPRLDLGKRPISVRTRKVRGY